MSGLQYAPGLAYVSGGGPVAKHFADALVVGWLLGSLAAVGIWQAWKAHKRGMERVRRYNERHAPRHARRK
jgi:hypothetical protein